MREKKTNESTYTVGVAIVPRKKSEANAPLLSTVPYIVRRKRKKIRKKVSFGGKSTGKEEKVATLIKKRRKAIQTRLQ